MGRHVRFGSDSEVARPRGNVRLDPKIGPK
jgi:hypothetical protein